MSPIPRGDDLSHSFRLKKLEEMVAELSRRDTVIADATGVPRDMLLLNDVTVPAVQTDVGVINDVTIPAIRTTAEQAATDATALQGKFPITATDISDGAISTPKLSADAIDGMTVTGALIRTAATGQRVEISSTEANRVRFYTGNASETAPGVVESWSTTEPLEAGFSMISPAFSGATPAEVQLSVLQGGMTSINADAGQVSLQAHATTATTGGPGNVFIRSDAGNVTLQAPSGGISANAGDIGLTANAISLTTSGGGPVTVNNANIVTTTASQTLTGKNLRNTSNAMPMRGGSGTFTGNGSGVITIPHGLGATPTWAVVIPHGTTLYFATIAGFTATEITANIVHKDGTANLGSGTLTFSWVCGITTV
jgi:hypothetical protein